MSYVENENHLLPILKCRSHCIHKCFKYKQKANRTINVLCNRGYNEDFLLKEKEAREGKK